MLLLKPFFLQRGRPHARPISHLWHRHPQPFCASFAPPAPHFVLTFAASVLPMLFGRRALRYHFMLKIADVLHNFFDHVRPRRTILPGSPFPDRIHG